MLLIDESKLTNGTLGQIAEDYGFDITIGVDSDIEKFQKDIDAIVKHLQVNQDKVKELKKLWGL